MERLRNERIVYSTDSNGGTRTRFCNRCGRPLDSCTCERRTTGVAPRARMPEDGIVRLVCERKGHRGKTMTLVYGAPGDDTALKDLLQQLKRLCGAGGTLKNGVLEIQGDHRDRVEPHLTALGMRVKRAGG